MPTSSIPFPILAVPNRAPRVYEIRAYGPEA